MTNTDHAATVIIGQKVRAECEQDFLRWQHELNNVASRYPGFLAAEITPPTRVQPDWVVVYRFDSVANVSAWINSAARQERLAVGQQYLDGPATQQVLGGPSKPVDELVTVVVTHRVGPPDVEEFLSWQARLDSAESKFRGYRGSELFRPIEGVQDKWTAMYRYDTATDLDAWLTSQERKQLLEEGAKFRDFELRTIDSSFGSWFAFDDRGDNMKPPSDFKTSVAVWVGLYPTVVLLSLALSPLKLPLWEGMILGNLLSSFVMTYVTMPYYVNPILKRWLIPSPDASRMRTNLWGTAVTLSLFAFWALVFYLVTRVFWSLP